MYVPTGPRCLSDALTECSLENSRVQLVAATWYSLSMNMSLKDLTALSNVDLLDRFASDSRIDVGVIAQLRLEILARMGHRRPDKLHSSPVHDLTQRALKELKKTVKVFGTNCLCYGESVQGVMDLSELVSKFKALDDREVDSVLTEIVEAKKPRIPRDLRECLA